MIINVIAKSYLTSDAITSMEELLSRQGFLAFLMRLSPNHLFSESTTILLTPHVKTANPFGMTMEESIGSIVSPLPLDQSLLLIWPQLTGIIAATLICRSAERRVGNGCR